MSDLLNASDLSATYYKPSGTLRLSGSYSLTTTVSKASFINVPLAGGISYEIRGQPSSTTTFKIPDQDIKMTLPNKATPSNTITFVTSADQPLSIPIKFVDAKLPPPTTNPAPTPAPAPGPGPAQQDTPILVGGRGGLPPVELAWDYWLDEAIKRVRGLYPTPEPALLTMSGCKVPNTATPGAKDVLSMEASFRVQRGNMVTVKGDAYTVSSPPGPAYGGYVDIGTGAAARGKMVLLNDVVNTAAVRPAGLAAGYQFVELYQVAGGAAAAGAAQKRPDQPYFYFMAAGPTPAADKRLLAIVGAWDGRAYDLPAAPAAAAQ